MCRIKSALGFLSGYPARRIILFRISFSEPFYLPIRQRGILPYFHRRSFTPLTKHEAQSMRAHAIDLHTQSRAIRWRRSRAFGVSCNVCSIPSVSEMVVIDPICTLRVELLGLSDFW